MMKISPATSRLALLCAFATLSAVSLADVKVVSQIKMTMFGGQQAPQTVTSYYKGQMIRSEAPNSISILNGKTNEVIQINSANKTYSVTKLGQGVKAMPQGVKMVANGKTRLTNETKTIAGKAARKYVFDGTMDMQAAGQGSGKIKLHVDQWTTSTMKLAMSPFQMAGMLGQMLQSLGPAGSGVRQLTAELGKIKGFPLSNNVVMDITAKGPGQTGAPGQDIKMSFTIQTDVLSLKEGPLSASLFQVPAGYKKVAKAGGGMGMGMGGMG